MYTVRDRGTQPWSRMVRALGACDAKHNLELNAHRDHFSHDWREATSGAAAGQHCTMAAGQEESQIQTSS